MRPLARTTALAGVLLAACLAELPEEPSPPNVGPVQAAWTAPVSGSPGSLVFYSNRDGNAEIYLMDPDGGSPQVVAPDPAEDIWPDLSPDGRHVAFASTRSGNREILVVDLSTGQIANVSNHAGDDNWPRWSPNGREIAFHSNRDGNYNLYAVGVDGTGLRRITNDPALDQWPDWSPNGRWMAFRRGVDVYVADAQAEELNVRRLTNLPTLDQMPVWSPDGRWIAFMSLRDGYPAVFLMSAEGDTPAQPAINLTPKDPADPNAAWLSRAPAWSVDGQRIYFMSRRPSTAGDVEIFLMNADGTGVVRLTTAAGEDGGPQTR